MKRGAFLFWAVFVVVAAVRVATSFGLEMPDASACLGQAVSGSGVVSGDPERKESGQVSVVMVTEARSEDGGICVRDIHIRMKTKLYPRLAHGDEIEFSGKLSRPFNFRSDDGREFDYQGFLAKDDIFYEMRSATVSSVVVSDSRFLPDSIQRALLSLKRGFVGNLERALGEPHAALAAGLVVGEKSALGAELLEDFRLVGLIHIVVLSGFNITIVGVAMRRMLSFLPRLWGIVLGAVGIALFGILVGGGATVVRSCFMAVIALVGDVIRRDYSVYRALAFAGLIMLIQNPLILLDDPSFQLSFLATLGLILLAGPLEERLPFITDKLGMRGTVATCLATQIFVSPMILYMMGQISIIGVLVNIVVLPLIPLTMLMVFLTGALGFVSYYASAVFGWFAHLLLSYELVIVEYAADMPMAAVDVPMFSGWLVVAFYATFFALPKLSSIFFQFRLAKKSST